MSLSAFRPVLSRSCSLIAVLAALAASARAGEVFVHPVQAGGGINASSWVDPDGSDNDTYAWDDFTLAETQTITEVRWRGGYQYAAAYGKVFDFRVSFFDTNITGNEPVITALPEHESQETVIATFHTNNNAGETYAGVSGGVTMYDYRYTLPTPVTLQGGVKYWFRVVGAQPTICDWGIATGTGGNGSHFYFNTGASMFMNWPHDLAFSLHAKWADLGQGTAGAAGMPALSGSGTLAPGSPCTLALDAVLPATQVFMVGGLARIDAPLKGGTLVPDPLVIVGLQSDGTGALAVPFLLPPIVPSGTEIVMQAWQLDPAVPGGYASSNGLSGTVP